MIYMNQLVWDLMIAGICILFVGINLIIGIIRYRKIKNNKTVGKHDSLVKLKLNEDIKVNDYELGLHIYADKAKDKWVLINDNPKTCDIYSFRSLEDYVLTVNGNFVIRSSMKDLVTEITDKKIFDITLDIFTKSKKYRYHILNKECSLNDNTFKLYYTKAIKFADILEYIMQ